MGHVHGLPNKTAKKYSVSTLTLSNNQGRNRKKIPGNEKLVNPEQISYKRETRLSCLVSAPLQLAYHTHSDPHNLARVGLGERARKYIYILGFGKGCVTYKRAYCSYSVLYMK